MKTLSNNEIKNIDGGVDVGGVAIAGVGVLELALALARELVRSEGQQVRLSEE